MPFRSSTDPERYLTYDIKNKLLVFESQQLLHKNAPCTAGGGDRYVCVFFNKDLDYASNKTQPQQRHCMRSHRILQQPPQRIAFLGGATHPTPARLRSIASKRRALWEVLHVTRFPEDRTSGLKPSSKYGANRGTFISFGVTQSRKNRAARQRQGLYTRKNLNQNNTKQARLFRALAEYVNAIVPNLFGTDDHFAYHGCIVAKNSQCEWHHDAGNIGPAVITALGSFRGGKLHVEDAAPLVRTAAPKTRPPPATGRPRNK
jgi:hypothetical protein